MRKIVTFGATSAIAEATLKHFAAAGDEICLVGRNADKLAVIADDLSVRGAGKVVCIENAMTDCEQHQELLARINAEFADFDHVFFAYGNLPSQQQCQDDVNEMLQALNINMTSIISLLTLIANYFESKGTGHITVISSVAGDRGRQSNYVYGTAKAGLTIFLQGLRNRLFDKGVTVLTIKPGFVDTPMTSEFKKGLLWVSADNIGKGIYQAIVNKRDTAYLPWFWQWIMLIIRLIPEAIFKRMKL